MKRLNKFEHTNFLYFVEIWLKVTHCFWRYSKILNIDYVPSLYCLPFKKGVTLHLKKNIPFTKEYLVIKLVLEKKILKCWQYIFEILYYLTLEKDFI